MTCRYVDAVPAPSGPDPPAALYAALGVVVAGHPMLRVGILDEHARSARFLHLPRVDLRDHVVFESLPAGEGYEQRLADVIAGRHDLKWEHLETRPPWTVVVVRPEGEAEDQGSTTVDIIFAYHHSILDGVSGKTFHQDLLAALLSPATPPPLPTSSSSSSSSSPAATATPYLLTFPSPPTLPEGQDDAVPPTLGIWFTARTLWRELGPQFLQPAKPRVWAGRPVDFAMPHRTRVLPVYLPERLLAALLAACRARGTSLTALLNALALASIARSLPGDDDAAPALAASTPISLRPYLAPATDPALRGSLRVLTTGIEHHFPAAEVASLRGEDPDEAVWAVAQRIRRELADRAASLPANDRAALLRYVPDMTALFRNSDGKARSETFSVSNIGVMPGRPTTPTSTTSSPPQDHDGEGRITRVLFANGAMVVGAALGVNVASVAGGDLGLAVSWQEGVVEEGVAARLARDLAEMPARFAETGRFFT